MNSGPKLNHNIPLKVVSRVALSLCLVAAHRYCNLKVPAPACNSVALVRRRAVTLPSTRQIALPENAFPPPLRQISSLALTVRWKSFSEAENFYAFALSLSRIFSVSRFAHLSALLARNIRIGCNDEDTSRQNHGIASSHRHSPLFSGPRSCICPTQSSGRPAGHTSTRRYHGENWHPFQPSLLPRRPLYRRIHERWRGAYRLRS